MVVTAKWLGTEAVIVPLLDDGRVEPGETAHFPGDVVDDDPNAAADSILIEREDGTRHALPLSLWDVHGAAGAVKTIPQILDAVDGDPVRARAALAAEQQRVKPRTSLVETLERIANDGPVVDSGGAPVASELPAVPEFPNPDGLPAATTPTEA